MCTIKISLFFLTWQWHIPNWIWDVSPNLCLHYLASLVNCHKHFGYPRPWHQTMWSEPHIFTIFFLRFYEFYFNLCNLIYVAKIHARCMWFEFGWVAFTNAITFLRCCSFMSNIVWWQCSISSMEFRHSFSTLVALTISFFNDFLLINNILFSPKTFYLACSKFFM